MNDPAAAASRLRVLVVEDDPDSRNMLKLFLELSGHDCQAVARVEQALRLVDEWSPDVALVDITLEGVDGYEVARRVRASTRTSIRLVATTGRADPVLAAEAGFHAVLEKPFELDALLDLLVAPGA